MIRKTVLVFVVVAILQVTALLELNAQASEAYKACAKQLNIKNIKNALTPGNKESNSKCMKHCVGLKLKYIKETGEPIIENIPKLVNFTLYVNKCSTQHTEGDKCNRVNNIEKCATKLAEADMQRISDVCAKENNVVVGDFRKLKENAITNVLNATLHCYFRCVLMKSTLMDTKANLKIDVFKSVIDAPIFEKISIAIGQCSADNNQRDICNKSVQRVVCMGQKWLNYEMQHLMK